MIQCNEITQTVNELLIAFQDCNKVKNSGAVTTTGVITFLVTYDYGWVL